MKFQKDGVTIFFEPIKQENLCSLDETLFDYDIPIYLRDISPDNEISTVNYRILCKAIEVYGGNADEVFAKYKRHAPEIMTHPKRFIASEDALFFHDCVKQHLTEKGLHYNFGTAFNPRFHLYLGHVGGKYQTLGRTMDFLAQFLPLHKAFEEAPKYARYFNNTELYKNIYNQNNTSIVLHKYFENYRHYYRFTQNKWSEGIYASISASRGLDPAESKIDYCIFDIIEVLQKDYTYLYLDMKLFQIKSEDINGIPRKSYYYMGQEFAKECYLEKTVLSQKRKKIQGKKVLLDLEAYDVLTNELDKLTKGEYEDLLKNRKIAVVTKIISDLVVRNELIFQKGEIYNAPYTRYTFSYPKQSGLENVYLKVRGPIDIVLSYQDTLDKELAATREETMRAMKEAQVAKKNEEIAKRETQRAEKAQGELELQILRERRRERIMTGGFAHEERNALTGSLYQLTDLNEYKDGQTVLSYLKDKSVEILKSIKYFESEYHVHRDEINDRFISHIRDQVLAFDFLEERIDNIRMGIERGLEITDRIRAYSKMQEFKRGNDEVDIVGIFTSYESLYASTIQKRGIRYQLSYDEKPIIIRGVEAQLDSIFRNLLLNAFDAIEENQEKIVNIAIHKIVMDLKQGVRIKVTDNGPGISQDKFDIIFDPFYSTKPSTGTGLGLSEAKRMTELYNGNILVESIEGEGCYVTVPQTENVTISMSQKHALIQVKSVPFLARPYRLLEQNELETMRSII